MIEKVQRCSNIAAEDGLTHAALVIARYVSPSPYAERFDFTRRFLENYPDESIPASETVGLWRHGLTPKSGQLYDLESKRPSSYVTDLDEEFASSINGSAAELADDKQAFRDVLRERGYSELLPEQFGTLSQGTVVEQGTALRSLLDEQGSLVVKSRTGAAGEGVHILSSGDDGYKIDGASVSSQRLQERVAEMDGYLVTEYCLPGEYIRSVYPHAANTLRIVTMNPKSGDPFIAAAVHRIGTETSGAIDNFSQGGLSAPVHDSGELGPAVRFLDGTVSWHRTHPDTGEPIAGVQIPDWQSIRETILAAAADVPELVYLGWDGIVTEDGLKIIEGNSNTDTDLLQAHGPLLTDSRVQQFYNRHLGK